MPTLCATVESTTAESDESTTAQSILVIVSICPECAGELRTASDGTTYCINCQAKVADPQ